MCLYVNIYEERFCKTISEPGTGNATTIFALVPNAFWKRGLHLLCLVYCPITVKYILLTGIDLKRKFKKVYIIYDTYL